MIVRCNNCLSAFSVNDNKVSGKIFAFTCPKCDTENIINNKIQDKQTDYKESVLDEDLFVDSGTDNAAAHEMPEHDGFELSLDEPSSDDMGEDQNTTKLSDDNKKLNLEIEEAEKINDTEGDDSIFEELLDDSPTEEKEDASSFDLDETEIPPLEDEFDIELKKDADAVKDDKDSILDDFGDSDFGDSDLEEKSAVPDDIDQLLMESGIDLEEGSESKHDLKDQDDDLIIDLENMDIASEDELGTVPESSIESDNESNGDSTIDVDSLDIELEETYSDDILADDSIKSEQVKDDFDDEDIKLNLDELDIDIDEIDDKNLENVQVGTDLSIDDVLGNEPVDGEDLTIDVDSLDIELDEVYPDDILADDSIKSEQYKDDFDDEDIKLNLDELDIDIDDIENRDPMSKGNVQAGMDKSIDYEDDEKLTLDDAGLTFDELTSKTKPDEFNELSEEEIKLTLDDIDPDLTLEEIIKSAEADSQLVLDSLEELPEIYHDEYDSSSQTADDSVYDDFDYDDLSLQESSHKKSNISFSIDFLLKYSRIQACLRLFFLYLISMIPHFIVLILYTVLSTILGFINQFVILATGRCVNDFGLIIENTMRYVLYIRTNLIGIVDDRPLYAGRQYFDHPLQFDAKLQFKYSKKIALLRLSIIGITIITLPHIVILTLLSLTMPICYLIGMLSVIITSRWPGILFKYLTKYFGYRARVSSFMLGLTDEYPPFRF